MLLGGRILSQSGAPLRFSSLLRRRFSNRLVQPMDLVRLEWTLFIDVYLLPLSAPSRLPLSLYARRDGLYSCDTLMEWCSTTCISTLSPVFTSEIRSWADLFGRYGQRDN